MLESLMQKIDRADERIDRWFAGDKSEARDSMSWEAYQSLFSFNGSQYGVGSNFQGVSGRYLLEQCGPAYTVLDRRASIMGEARPSFQRLEAGKPTTLFSTAELDLLKEPWVGGTWRQLIAAAEADVAACGNSYWIRDKRELVRLDADWVTIVSEKYEIEGAPVGHRLIGYIIQPPAGRPTLIGPELVAHYRPGTPVTSPFRGESWLAAVASDTSSDIELTKYKNNYLRNGAMPSMAVMYEPTLTQDQLESFVEMFKDKFVGAMNAGKVMHFLGGRDIKTVGATLDQLAFKAVQGGGETRIAAAAGVPAAVAGFSEGLQGSSLNAGNYTATRRLFGDAKVRPLLGAFCEAFSNIVQPPAGTRLWFDDSGVSFFQEDVSDEANIRSTNAQTIRTLIEAGYDPDSVVAAVTTGNFDRLVGQHSGLYSVQLQPSNTGDTPALAPPDDDDEPPARSVIHNIYPPVINIDNRSEPPVVNVDARQEPPVVNVTTPDVSIDPTFNFTMPDIDVDARQEPPVVNVDARQEPPVVNVDNRSEPAVINVDARQEPPVVNVAAPNVTVEAPPEQRATRKTIEHTADGRIAAIVEEPL